MHESGPQEVWPLLTKAPLTKKYTGIQKWTCEHRIFVCLVHWHVDVPVYQILLGSIPPQTKLRGRYLLKCQARQSLNFEEMASHASSPVILQWTLRTMYPGRLDLHDLKKEKKLMSDTTVQCCEQQSSGVNVDNLLTVVLSGIRALLLFKDIPEQFKELYIRGIVAIAAQIDTTVFNRNRLLKFLIVEAPVLSNKCLFEKVKNHLLCLCENIMLSEDVNAEDIIPQCHCAAQLLVGVGTLLD
jgi:hypothetical protein